MIPRKSRRVIVLCGPQSPEQLHFRIQLLA
jgi:hypothetical protein